MAVQYEEVQQWLQQNGGNFSSGKITIRNEKGDKAIGILDWSLVKELNQQSSKVLKIPFVFDQNSNSKTHKVLNSGNFGAAPIMVNLYIQQAADGTISALVKLSNYSNVWDKETRSKESTVFTVQSKVAQSTVVEGAANRFAFIGDGAAATANRSVTGYDCATTVSYRKETTWVDGDCGPGCYGELIVKTIKRTHTRCTPTTGGSQGELQSTLDCEDACGGNPYEEVEEEMVEKEDPCDKMKKIAAALQAALNTPEVKGKLDSLKTTYKNAANEYGFYITKDAAGNYHANAISTSSSSSSWNFTYGATENVAAIVHTHPFGGSAIHSSTDIYGLNNHFSNPDFLGSIVVQGDNVHVLSITDDTQYANFVAKKDKFYDKETISGWKKKSNIDDDFKDFSTDYTVQKSTSDIVLFTQMYLMQEYKMGVGLQKLENTIFKPQALDIVKKQPTTGGNNTYNFGGQIITDYESVEPKDPCEK